MSEVRIIFEQLEFQAEVLKFFKNNQNNRGITLNEGDSFILSMSWPWRAPDKEEFLSLYPIKAESVLKKKPVSDSESANLSHIEPVIFRGSDKNTFTKAIQEPDKLRIRTEAFGESTIIFSLTYADKFFSSPFFSKLFKGLGGLFITKITGGIGSIYSQKILETFGNHILGNLDPSESSDKEVLHPLGEAKLNYTDGIQRQQNIDFRHKDSNEVVAKLELTLGTNS